MSHKERVYTSDMSDKELEIIEPLLPLEWEGPSRPLELAIAGDAVPARSAG